MKRRVLLAGAMCAVLTAPAAAEKKVEYMAVFLGGKKVGHMVHTREVVGGKVHSSEEMAFTITRMNTPMTVRQVESAVETTSGEPLSFRTVQDMGILTQITEGTVAPDGTVTVTVSSGQQKTQRKVQWPEGALLSEGLRLLSRKMGLKEGTAYQAKAFTGAMLQALEVKVTIGATKEVDLLGRVLELTESKMVMSGPSGQIETTSYVNDDFDALKTVVPAMGMQMELIACTKQVALSPSEPMDFFEKVVVASPKPLPGVESARSITYEIQPTGAEAKLSFLTTPSQTVAPGPDGRITVTVTPAEAPKSAFPYRGDDADALAALKPTRHLQSDAKELAGLAKVAAQGATDAADAAAKIESYVSKYIRTKDLSVGYATALEVATSRQGDCTEHAVLAAAMCRAAGIPAQVVTGLAYIPRLGEKRDVFVPHAWYRIFAGGKWIDYDAALGGFNAGHVALTAGDGEPTDFFGIVSTLGYFRIVSVEVKR